MTTFPRTSRGKCRAQAQHHGKIFEVSVVTPHKFPRFRWCRRRLKFCKFSSSTRWLKSLRSCRAKTSAKDPRYGNSWKFPDRIVDVPVVLKRQCHPRAQVLGRVPTTGAKDAKMQRDPKVSPQSGHTPSAKTIFTRKSRERQPTKLAPGVLEAREREREPQGSTKCVDRSISAHISESRRAH